MTQKQLIPLVFRKNLEQLKNRLIHKLNYLCADLSLLNLDGQARSEASQSLTSSLGILILGRGTYHEKHEWFSIASSEELRKVLKLRDQQTKSFHYIGPLQNGKRPVLTVTPYADVAPFCQRAILVLPVTVLIAHSLPEGLSNVHAYDTSFFLLKHADGWSSALPSLVLNNPENALLLLGGHPESDLFTYSGTEFYSLLQSSLAKVRLAQWRAGWIGFTSTKSSFPWNFALGVSAALLLFYSILSTSYLSIMNNHRQQEIDDIGPQLTELLATKRQFDKNQELVSAIESRLSERNDTIKIWTLMAVMQMKDYKVSKLQWIDERLNLTVESQSATDALQFIMEQHFVDSAEFTAPVRRGLNQQEVFSAKVRFNNENLTESEPSVNAEGQAEAVASND